MNEQRAFIDLEKNIFYITSLQFCISKVKNVLEKNVPFIINFRIIILVYHVECMYKYKVLGKRIESLPVPFIAKQIAFVNYTCTILLESFWKYPIACLFIKRIFYLILHVIAVANSLFESDRWHHQS